MKSNIYFAYWMAYVAYHILHLYHIQFSIISHIFEHLFGAARYCRVASSNHCTDKRGAKKCLNEKCNTTMR